MPAEHSVHFSAQQYEYGIRLSPSLSFSLSLSLSLSREQLIAENARAKICGCARGQATTRVHTAVFRAWIGKRASARARSCAVGVGAAYERATGLAHANTASGWLILINNQKQMRPQPAPVPRARQLRNNNYLSLSSLPYPTLRPILLPHPSLITLHLRPRLLPFPPPHPLEVPPPRGPGVLQARPLRRANLKSIRRRIFRRSSRFVMHGPLPPAPFFSSPPEPVSLREYTSETLCHIFFVLFPNRLLPSVGIATGRAAVRPRAARCSARGEPANRAGYPRRGRIGWICKEERLCPA